jgi:small multidrug resistance pump
MNHWLLLVLAILFEVAGTLAIKFSAGFTRPLPSVLLFVFYLLSFAALALALKRIELSIAYAIWAGVGMALITLIGLVFFKEPNSLVKMVSITLIIIGVVGLNLNKMVA